MSGTIRRLLSLFAATPTASAPAYVDHPISMIAPPPYLFEGVDTFSYLLGDVGAGHSKSESLIDKFLNDPLRYSEKNRVYRSPKNGKRPLLSFSRIRTSRAASDPQGREISYREVAILLPVIIRTPGSAPNIVGYYPPVLFIDGPAAPEGKDCSADCWHATSPIVIGREMFGLPKVRAEIELDFSHRSLDSATVSMFGETLISAKNLKRHDDFDDPTFRTKEQRKALAEQIYGAIRPEDDRDDWVVGWTVDENARVDLEHAGFGNPLVGLRQFRDPKEFAKASGQAVVESLYKIDPSNSGMPLGNKVKIELSPRLHSELGLNPCYEIEYANDGAVFRNVSAKFADLNSTVVRLPRNRPESAGV